MSLCLLILQIGCSIKLKLRGSLKAECAVLTLCKSVAAIPDDATAMAMLLCALTLESRRLRRNIFHGPQVHPRRIYSHYITVYFQILRHTLFSDHHSTVAHFSLTCQSVHFH